MRVLTILIAMSLLQVGAVEAGTFAFGKKADEARIAEILPLSRTDKIQKMQEAGVYVEAHDFSGSQILGQFLDSAHYPEMLRPTIWLSERADEWTLVHEYIHYLFSLNEKPGKMISDSEQDQALELLTKNWNAYEQNKWRYLSDDHRVAVKKSFMVVAKAFMQKMETFEFEEIAIEIYLRGIYQSHRPVGFTDQAWIRSRNYIYKSAMAALGKLRDLSVSCTDLELSYTREHMILPQDVVQICNKIQERRTELQTVTKAAGITVAAPADFK